MKVSRALLSVSDKTGLEALAQGLADLGTTIISTGGTADALRSWGIEVVPSWEVPAAACISASVSTPERASTAPLGLRMTSASASI